MTVLQSTLVFFLCTKFLSEQILSYLNFKKIKQNQFSVPRGVSEYMTPKEWQKCTNYSCDKIRFSYFETIFSFLLSIFVLFYLLPIYYLKWSFFMGHGIWEASLLTSAFILMLQQIDLPLDWYRQFKLEAKFDFNNQTLKLWITDKIKEFFLGVILLFTIMCLLHTLYAQLSLYAPKYWWALACLALFVFQLFLMVLWPRFVMPLFNTLTPLNDPGLRDQLNVLCDKTGFEMQEILVMDGSKRSSHSNAFFTGFGKFRKIVLFDTLIKQMSQNEIVSVVAHEVGHYKLGHIPKRLCLSFIFALLFFWLIDQILVSSWFARELDIPDIFSGEIGPVLVTFILFGGCITYWLSPLSNFLSRKHEFEADDYAVWATGSSDHLSSALKKLSVKNLSYPLPHPLVSFFYHSHPSLPERELNINKAHERFADGQTS